MSKEAGQGSKWVWKRNLVIEVINLEDIKELIRKNMLYFFGIIIIAILCIYVLIFKPHATYATAPRVLDPTYGFLPNRLVGGAGLDDIGKLIWALYDPYKAAAYNLIFFGLGLDTTILLWIIGTYLLYRWYKGGRTNISQLVWGIVFFIYSITFIGHIFKGLGNSWANENAAPENFFLLRFGMIFWAAGSLYGILRLLIEDKKLRIIPSIFVMLLGFIWFSFGLFIVRDIEYMMYGFLFAIWIPICFSISYIFFNYGQKSGYSGPKIIFLGYLGLTITYMGWAPWHFSDVIYFYFFWYFLFLLSLVPILIGFMMLTKESEKK
ncbi:MAG: hypothetical protein HWN67_06185 [Candidatus Helarchaeota archaeon]|nr:hypothetical protein [Candidatus Helarchaeota archaeon]